jgi:secreted trypsin-like serine protease
MASEEPTTKKVRTGSRPLRRVLEAYDRGEGPGRILEGIPNALMEVTLPAVSNARCNKPASYDGKIKNMMFCAGRKEGGPDSCQGDSGGPATVTTPTGLKLAGIVSWGDGCGFPNKYGVYTRVSAFTSWVEQKTAGAIKW